MPAKYREFLKITDGLDLAAMRLHGVNDLYELEGSRLPGIVVALDSDDRDDFVVAIRTDGAGEAVFRIDVHDPEAIARTIAEDFAQYLMKRVELP